MGHWYCRVLQGSLVVLVLVAGLGLVVVEETRDPMETMETQESMVLMEFQVLQDLL